MKINYLLIDGTSFIPYNKKWQLFDDLDDCMAEARKLGWGKGMISLPVSDEPGIASMEKGGNFDLTIIPLVVQ